MNGGQQAVLIIAIYLTALLAVGLLSTRVFRGTSLDFFVASHAIGPFVLLMSVFGATMTSFAIIGSSREAFVSGIGVYGQMVSWSGIFHSICFFFVAIKLWSFGKRYGYGTQIQFFRDRFESDKLGLILFPALVGLSVPYLLMGVIGASTAIENITAGAFPVFFASTKGGIPFWLGGIIVCVVTLTYVLTGGVRAAAWANTFQTLVFVSLGVVTFFVVAHKLGGPVAATRQVIEYNPAHLKLDANAADKANYEQQLAAFKSGESKIKPREPKAIPPTIFFNYLLIPFSVAMFPHLFQHWLTAKSARAFKLTVVAHPILMMLTWLPCVLIGIWATSAVMPDGSSIIPPNLPDANAVLPIMVRKLAPPLVGGLMVAGVLAAIMSTLDSQFLVLGSIFTNDIVLHYGRRHVSDKTVVFMGRAFIIGIVVATYALSLYARGTSIFRLGIWCFTGFASLSPLVFAALYWKRVTKAGAYACILAALGTGLWLYFKSHAVGEDEPTVFGVMPVTINMAAAAVALVLVSLITSPPSPATIQKFHGSK